MDHAAEAGPHEGFAEEAAARQPGTPDHGEEHQQSRQDFCVQDSVCCQLASVWAQVWQERTESNTGLSPRIWNSDPNSSQSSDGGVFISTFVLHCVRWQADEGMVLSAALKLAFNKIKGKTKPLVADSVIGA